MAAYGAESYLHSLRSRWVCSVYPEDTKFEGLSKTCRRVCGAVEKMIFSVGRRSVRVNILTKALSDIRLDSGWFQRQRSLLWIMKSSWRICRSWSHESRKIVELLNLPPDQMPTREQLDYCFKPNSCFLDFEKIAKEYDALEVTSYSALSEPLHGWDCNSIVVVRPEVVEIVWISSIYNRVVRNA